jgi:hypothetical protein
MLKKLFRRVKTTPATMELVTPDPLSVPPADDSPDDFNEEWEHKWHMAHEVIEGNGGETEWDSWAQAVEIEKNAFATTVPHDEIPFAPTVPDSEFGHSPTVPMPLIPK